MESLLLIALAATISFIIGVMTGAANKVSVDKAIAELKAAEASAQATLDKITKHKAT